MTRLLAALAAVFLFLAITPEARPLDEDLLAEYPHVTLSNGILRVPVFLPDGEHGFYRSTRFDWSGIVAQVVYKGHTYFMKRKNQRPHNPEHYGHAMGLAEEFDIGGNVPVPQRFEEAKPGETFMKIAVGNLEKTDGEKPYHFSAPYRLVDPGEWKTRRGKTWVEFVHTLRDDHGFGYIYSKRIELTPDEPELIISHSLENTGKRTLETTQYCHNYFIIDAELIGKGYRMDLPFPARAQADLSPEATIEGGSLILNRDLEKSLFSTIEGYSETPAHNRAVIRNTRTGAGVDIGGDFPLAAFNFFAEPYSFCPELFIRIEAKPGETRKWTRTYRFFTDANFDSKI